MKLYRIGSKGKGVVWIQKRLRVHGCPVKVDGRFGPATKAAVAKLQRARGIKHPSGTVGPWTLRVLAGKRSTRPSPAPTPGVLIDKRRKVKDGVDISANNGQIEFRLLAKHAGFVIAKATEGQTFNDSKFESHRQRARAAGIPFGAYHFARPDNNSPEDEVEHLLRVAGKPRRGDLPHTLDYEVYRPGGGDQQWISRWVNSYEYRTGHKPLIYGGSVLRERTSINFGCKLWIPFYNIEAPSGNWLPAGWRSQGYTIWQYSESAHLPGIAGPTDINHWRGSLYDLKATLV